MVTEPCSLATHDRVRSGDAGDCAANRLSPLFDIAGALAFNSRKWERRAGNRQAVRSTGRRRL